MSISIVSIKKTGVFAALAYSTPTVTNLAQAADKVIVLDSGEAQLTLIDPD
ncbi:hypothetical protein WN982_26815 [Paraburkholderia sp. IMGN_8]|uniref:hypothetical protein n=1 Tax=Paraburkholderia sp. IMGN_8 TaxID=3136564 RepID=UPI0031019C4B